MGEGAKKVAFLRGMAEGMDLKADSAQNKLILRLLETLEEMADEIDDLKDRQDELEQIVDEIDSNLGDVEEALFTDEEDEDEDCDCGCGHHHHSHGAWEEEEDEDDQEEDGGEDQEGMDFIEYECPHCHTGVYYDQEAFDLEEEHLCPQCGKELFPNVPEEE